MVDVKDYIGKKFGFLTLTNDYITKKNRKLYKCICDCGNESYVRLSELIKGHTKSCGKCHLVRDINSSYLVGKRFGKLTAIRPIGEDSYKRSIWLFKCDCGRDYIGPLHNVKSGNTKSCGCGKHKQAVNALDLVGQTFNRLTVVAKDKIKNGIVYWKCRCICGNEVVRTTGALRSGGVQSCGCLVDDIQNKASYNYKWAHDVRELHERCIKCGSAEHLHAHHIFPRNQYPEKILDPLNGITLCGRCHRKFHHLYGHKCTLEDLAEYINMDKNIYEATKSLILESNISGVTRALNYLNKYLELNP